MAQVSEQCFAKLERDWDNRGTVRVLVIEDEVRLSENIAAALRESAGYAVDISRDGREALLLCEAASYDLVLLDLMLPGLRGQEVLRRLRSKGDNTPVLVITAVSETRNTIELLNLGADDYVTKPFDLGELIARARALVRRGKGIRQTTIEFGPISVNLNEQTVLVDGKSVAVSPTEYRVLEYLLHRPKTVVSKQELLEHLYDFTWEHHSNVIEAHISNLRKKIRARTPDFILETLRGRGYRLGALELNP
jgi:two-component system response regulator PhoP